MNKNRFTVYPISLALFLIFACVGIGISQTDDVATAQVFVLSNEASIDGLKPFEKFQLLRKLAPAAYKAGDNTKAERFARTLRETAEDLVRENKAYSSSLESATHVSNTVLGLVAFENGDLSKAGEHLIAAGTLKSGTPSLRTFGPNMLLAKKLVERGKREVVLEYLDKCSSFWQLEKGRVAEWKKTIEDGEVPDFGGNLALQVSDWKN